MKDSWTALYADRFRRVPTEPVILNLDSTAPERLCRILAAIGLQVVSDESKTEADMHIVRTTNTEITIRASRGPVEKDTIYFLVDDLDQIKPLLETAGAPLVQDIQLSSWGRRATFGDPDDRRLVLTEKTSQPRKRSITERPGAKDQAAGIANPTIVRSREMLRSIRTHRAAVATIALGMLANFAGLFLHSQIDSWRAEVIIDPQLFLKIAVAGSFCSLIGKAICLTDRGKVLETHGAMIAVGFELIAVCWQLYALSSEQLGWENALVIQVLGWLTMLTFVLYLREYGTATHIDNLRISANRGAAILSIIPIVAVLLVLALLFLPSRGASLFVIGLLKIAFGLLLMIGGIFYIASVICSIFWFTAALKSSPTP